MKREPILICFELHLLHSSDTCLLSKFDFGSTYSSLTVQFSFMNPLTSLVFWELYIWDQLRWMMLIHIISRLKQKKNSRKQSKTSLDFNYVKPCLDFVQLYKKGFWWSDFDFLWNKTVWPWQRQLMTITSSIYVSWY